MNPASLGPLLELLPAHLQMACEITKPPFVAEERGGSICSVKKSNPLSELLDHRPIERAFGVGGRKALFIENFCRLPRAVANPRQFFDAIC